MNFFNPQPDVHRRLCGDRSCRICYAEADAATASAATAPAAPGDGELDPKLFFLAVFSAIVAVQGLLYGVQALHVGKSLAEPLWFLVVVFVTAAALAFAVLFFRGALTLPRLLPGFPALPSNSPAPTFRPLVSVETSLNGWRAFWQRHRASNIENRRLQLQGWVARKAAATEALREMSVIDFVDRSERRKLHHQEQSERDDLRCWAWVYPYRWLAYGGEFMVVGFTLVAAWVYAQQSPGLTVLDKILVVLGPAAAMFAEASRPYLASASQTSPSSLKRKFAAGGFCASAVITILSVALLLQVNFGAREAAVRAIETKAAIAQSAVDSAQHDRHVLEDAKDKAKQVLDDQLKRLQEARAAAKAAQQFGPLKPNSPEAKSLADADAAIGPARKTFNNAEAALRKFTSAKVDLALAKVQAELAETKSKSNLHLAVSTFTGVPVTDITPKMMSVFTMIAVGVPSVVVGFIGSLLSVLAVNPIQRKEEKPEDVATIPARSWLEFQAYLNAQAALAAASAAPALTFAGEHDNAPPDKPPAPPSSPEAAGADEAPRSAPVSANDNNEPMAGREPEQQDAPVAAPAKPVGMASAAKLLKELDGGKPKKPARKQGNGAAKTKAGAKPKTSAPPIDEQPLAQ